MRANEVEVYTDISTIEKIVDALPARLRFMRFHGGEGVHVLILVDHGTTDKPNRTGEFRLLLRESLDDPTDS